jgi:hypothetical protein
MLKIQRKKKRRNHIAKFNLLHQKLFRFISSSWMDGWMFSGWSSTPARGPQDGPNVHHGFIFDVTITYFCIRPDGFTDETISVLHVFG